MKRLLPLLLLALSAPMFAAPGVKMYFVFHSNTPLCIPGSGQSFGCLPYDLRKAGLMVFAKSDDPSVTAFRFTVTATMLDGSTIKKTLTVGRNPDGTYSGDVLWLSSEVSDFVKPVVSVVGLRDSDVEASGASPGIEY